MKKLLLKILNLPDRHFDQVLAVCGSLFFFGMSAHSFFKADVQQAKILLITALVFYPLSLFLLFLRDHLNRFLGKLLYKKFKANVSSVTVSYEGDVLRYQQGMDISDMSIQEITVVRVKTTDRGPMENDCWVEIESSKKNIVYPINAQGAEEILSFFEKLPGFDFNQYATAMGSTDHAEFICWSR